VISRFAGFSIWQFTRLTSAFLRRFKPPKDLGIEEFPCRKADHGAFKYSWKSSGLGNAECEGMGICHVNDDKSGKSNIVSPTPDRPYWQSPRPWACVVKIDIARREKVH
jgi:hypothetical protein